LHRLAVLDARRHDDGQRDLLVHAHRAVVEIERGDGEHAAAVMRLHRLQSVRQNGARVLGRNFEGAVDRVAVEIAAGLCGVRASQSIPSARMSWARNATPSLSWSWVWGADKEMRKRERCLATAG